MGWVRFWDRRQSIYYECRQCGTGLADKAGKCPHCGSESVAVYKLR